MIHKENTSSLPFNWHFFSYGCHGAYYKDSTDRGWVYAFSGDSFRNEVQIYDLENNSW